MIRIKLISSILFLSFFFEAKAEVRKAIVFGGGCESEWTGNRFTSIMASQIKGLKKNGWEVTSLFNDANSAEELAAEGNLDKNQIKEASKKTLLEALDNILKDKSMKSGASVFISFNTHGQPKKGGEGHQLCISPENKEERKSEEMMDLDDPEILSRLRKLKDKGIKMGFSDMSCYSGASVPILSEFGCIVSSQTSNAPSFTYGVAGALAATLNGNEAEQNKKSLNGNGKITLEDIYVDALINGSSYVTNKKKTPTPYAQQATSSIFQNISPYQNALIDMIEKRSPYFPVLSEDEMCLVKEASLKSIENFFTQIKDEIVLKVLEDISGRKIHDLAEFKANLLKRISERSATADQYNKLGLEERHLSEEISKIDIRRSLKTTIPQEIVVSKDNFQDALSVALDGIKVTKTDNGIFELETGISPIEFDSSKVAKKMYDFLSERTGIPAYSLTEKMIPSIKSIQEYLDQIKNDFNGSVDKDAYEKFKMIVDKRNEVSHKIYDLRGNYPFLQGSGGVNQISKDFNLLTGYAYLIERQKWLQSDVRIEQFEACKNFVFN